MSEPIGMMIKEVRKQKGLTLKKLSELTGVGKGTLSRIENGKRSPLFETVRRIEKGLPVPDGFFSNIGFRAETK